MSPGPATSRPRGRSDLARPPGRRSTVRVSAESRVATPVRHMSPALLPSAALGAATALAVGLASLFVLVTIALLGWILAGDRTGIRAVLEVAGSAWLLAQGAPLGVGGATVWLPPLGLTTLLVAVTAWACARTASRAGIHGRRRSLQFVAGAAVAGGGLAGLVTLLAGGSGGIPIWIAPAPAALLVALGAGLGVTSSAVGLRAWRRSWPAWLRSESTAAFQGLGAMIGGAFLLFVAALAWHWREAWDVAAALRPGFSGSVGLAVMALAYAPTIAVWSAGYVMGAGVSLGADVVSAPWSVATGDVPAFPLFAAVPASSGGWLWVVLIVPLLGGLVACRRLGLWPGGVDDTWWRQLRGWLPVVRCAGLMAAGAGFAALIADGTLGGRLGPLGPSPLTMAAIAAAWCLIGAGLAAAWGAIRERRRPETPVSGPVLD